MQQREKRPSTLLKGTAIVSLLTMLSRFLGFIREALTARLIGSGFASDAYFVAFRIPNLLRSIVAEGALTSAFVPVLAGELQKSREDARRALQQVHGFLLVVTSLLVVAGMFFAEEIAQLFAPGFEPDKRAYTALLTRIMFPYLICMALVAMLNGALNSVGVFGTAALAQVIINGALISGALVAAIFPHENAPEILALSVVIGGVLGVTSQLKAVRKAGFSFCPSLALHSPVVRQLVMLMLPAIFGAAVYQLNVFIGTIFASLLGEGAVSWLFYADRLAQLPIGVFTVALASVLLPALSNARARSDHTQFAEQLADALRYTSFFMIPIAATLALLAEPLVELLFEGGKFSHESTVRSAAALQAMSFGLWGVSCHSVGVRAFIARKDTVLPALLGVLSLLCSVLFSLILMGPPVVDQNSALALFVSSAQRVLAQLIPTWSLGHTGLALSSSIASLVSFVTLSLLISLRVQGMLWQSFILTSLRGLISVLAAIHLLRISGVLALAPVFSIVLTGPALIGLYLIFTATLKTREAAETFALLRRYISRRKS